MTENSTAWMNEVPCRGMGSGPTFFPDRGESCEPARAICAACHCQARCLLYAIENREKFGVWGGTSERERRRLRRDLAALTSVRIAAEIEARGAGTPVELVA